MSEKKMIYIMQRTSYGPYGADTDLVEARLSEDAANKERDRINDFYRERGHFESDVCVLPVELSDKAARIIDAAPELLDALEELADLVDAIRDGEYTPDSFTTQPARAAIAKARGEDAK